MTAPDASPRHLMSNHPTEYKIEDTPCFPCRWKVVPVGNWKPNNSWTEYFRTKDEAAREVKRRGAMLLP